MDRGGEEATQACISAQGPKRDQAYRGHARAAGRERNSATGATGICCIQVRGILATNAIGQNATTHSSFRAIPTTKT